MIQYHSKRIVLLAVVMYFLYFSDAKKVVQTDDRDEFKRYINNIQAEWGGDCAEPSMNGILLGLQYSQPGSFIYVFTDASAKDYSNATEIKNMCQKKQTQVLIYIPFLIQLPNILIL